MSNFDSAVQVVSETHKLTDSQGPATVLSRSICATPGPKSKSRRKPARSAIPLTEPTKPPPSISSPKRRKARPATAEANATLQSPGTHSDGLTIRETQTKRAVRGRAKQKEKPTDAQPDQLIHGGGAQLGSASHEFASPAAVGDDGVQSTTAAPGSHDAVIAEIVQLWRMRQRWHRAEKSLVLQGKALCRSWCDGDKEVAGKLFDGIADGSAGDPTLQIALMPFLSAIRQFKPERAALEKQLRKLAETLPVSPWVAGIKGFGFLRLASIVGETGDVGSYRNPSCLWKRMGLAVIRGERQRRVSDTELALEMGYAPARRAIAYLMGQEIMRGAALAAADKQQYRKIYDDRREYEMPRCEALTGVMTARFGKYSPKAHAHNRAARYMTKRILRDLWAAWRVANRNNIAA